MPVLTDLWEDDRLKWSAEPVALNLEFAPLFTEAEREIARRRLEQFGYDPSAE